MANILIVDDHPIFREGIKKILATSVTFNVAGEADNGREALMLATQNSYDMIILDVAMPEISGLEVLERLKSSRPEVPVLIVSMYSEKRYALQALKNGASGFLTKDSAAKELTSALNKIMAGGIYVSSGVADQLLTDLKEPDKTPLHQRLSGREFQILQMIASGKRLKEIARELSLTVSTVSTHRLRILEKMRLKNNAEIIHYAIRQGLLKMN
jgi:DNA-binding NarL/FixJ family response regulator